MSAPHAAVKHELLVRYLDAWTPAALHGHKRVTFVAGCRPSTDSALAAVRVFGEFADLLERHTLLMLLAGPARSDAGDLDQVRHRLVQAAAEYGSPAGLVISTSVDPLPSALADAG
ncbi:MAG TPA: hypothetical protein VF163_01750, partial [Micromonosporaceae bacterium]